MMHLCWAMKTTYVELWKQPSVLKALFFSKQQKQKINKHMCFALIFTLKIKNIYGTCYMFLLVLFLSIVGVFAFCKLMKLLIIHCYCLQYIVIKYTIFFVVWFKVSITHFLHSSQKPFVNVTQKCQKNTQVYCQKHIVAFIVCELHSLYGSCSKSGLRVIWR